MLIAALFLLAQTERVDKLFAQYDRPDSPGCAVGVIQDGRFIYKRGYGSANLDYGVPLTAKSVFYIASTSKQFTAASIAILADQGRISLEDDVRKYVPELPDYGQVVRIRHLVHHTSGIRDYLTLMSLAGMPYENVLTEENTIALIARQRELNFKPGEEYLYSNSGYFLLSVIVKRASGKSLGQFADEHIFKPLGMKNTHFHENRNLIVKERVTAYAAAPENSFRVEYYSNFDKVGDGGLLTSVDDLYLWDQNFYENKLRPRNLMEQIQIPGKFNDGRSQDYAFGLNIGEYKGLASVSHGGSFMGFRTELLRFPGQRFSVVCLCNVSIANPASLARQVADIYLAEDIQKGLTQFAGRFHSPELEATYDITVVGENLMLRGSRLNPSGRDSFAFGSSTLRFNRNSGGIITGFNLEAGRVRNIHFARTGS